MTPPTLNFHGAKTKRKGNRQTGSPWCNLNKDASFILFYFFIRRFFSYVCFLWWRKPPTSAASEPYCSSPPRFYKVNFLSPQSPLKPFTVRRGAAAFSSVPVELKTAEDLEDAAEVFGSDTGNRRATLIFAANAGSVFH